MAQLISMNLLNKEFNSPVQDFCMFITGRELSLAQQYAVVGVCSFPLFWLAGAGSAVFWVIGWYYLFIVFVTKGSNMIFHLFTFLQSLQGLVSKPKEIFKS